MAPVRPRIRLAIALSILSTVAALGALWGCAAAAAAILRAPAAWPWAPLSGALAATIAAYVLRLAAFDQSHYAAFRLERLLRTRLADHLACVPLGLIEDEGAGALAKVVHDDVRALHVFVADSTPFYARAYAMPLISFGLLAALDWRLALAAAGVLALGAAGLAFAMRNHDERTRRYNAAREHVSAAILDYVRAMPVVRTFESGGESFGRYQKALDIYLHMLIDWYREARLSGRFALAVLSPLPTLLALLWLGALLVQNGTLGVSSWVAALLFGTGMAEALMPLMMLNHMVEKAKQSAGRISGLLALPPQPIRPPGTARPADGSVEFQRVRFRHDGADCDALTDLSFTAKPGTVTALVGPSGAGKTTVARLIPRFFDVADGTVRVGGVDVRDMSPETLLGHVAFVFQETFLFAGSIADNIRLGCPDAGDDAVVAAARAAQAHDFIMALPQGYQTRAGERGAFLSGGQRQRIAIARALLQDRPILVLDEATAFADPENEVALVAALSALMRGRTVLIVTHRLATISTADQILVLDGGRVVARGTHDALLAQGSLYARLWTTGERAQAWAFGAAHPDGDAT